MAFTELLTATTRLPPLWRRLGSNRGLVGVDHFANAELQFVLIWHGLGNHQAEGVHHGGG
jgi:hypothetical protein